MRAETLGDQRGADQHEEAQRQHDDGRVALASAARPSSIDRSF
jgi:hypothetical protein